MVYTSSHMTTKTIYTCYLVQFQYRPVLYEQTLSRRLSQSQVHYGIYYAYMPYMLPTKLHTVTGSHWVCPSAGCCPAYLTCFRRGRTLQLCGFSSFLLLGYCCNFCHPGGTLKMVVVGSAGEHASQPLAANKRQWCGDHMLITTHLLQTLRPTWDLV